jgi:hypothetical protein
MTATLEDQPTITRQQESALYRFLREETNGDHFRYELIAKKIHRAADGCANEWDSLVVRNWLAAMNESNAQEAATETS